MTWLPNSFLLQLHRLIILLVNPARVEIKNNIRPKISKISLFLWWGRFKKKLRLDKVTNCLIVHMQPVNPKVGLDEVGLVTGPVPHCLLFPALLPGSLGVGVSYPVPPHTADKLTSSLRTKVLPPGDSSDYQDWNFRHCLEGGCYPKCCLTLHRGTCIQYTSLLSVSIHPHILTLQECELNHRPGYQQLSTTGLRTLDISY